MTSLSGKRVLVVEDEFLIALMLIDALQAEQAEVVGPAATHESALALIACEHIDIAVIDLNLRGVCNDALGLELQRRHIPFLIATGYGKESQTFAAPVLAKPFTAAQFITTLSGLLSL
jgi:DNA-binding NarL/FixJ family response regulator